MLLDAVLEVLIENPANAADNTCAEVINAFKTFYCACNHIRRQIAYCGKTANKKVLALLVLILCTSLL